MASDILDVASDQPPSDWNLESGYSEFPDKRAQKLYPYRVFGTGLQSSLIVLLQSYKTDVDHLCGGGIQGFNVMFHPPNEGPEVLKKFYYVSPEKMISLSIRPSTITTQESLRSYTPSVRRCFFDSERKLQFYKQYTQSNCELECLSNYTLAICGCVRFSMPRTSFRCSFYEIESLIFFPKLLI